MENRSQHGHRYTPKLLGALLAACVVIVAALFAAGGNDTGTFPGGFPASASQDIPVDSLSSDSVDDGNPGNGGGEPDPAARRYAQDEADGSEGDAPAHSSRTVLAKLPDGASAPSLDGLGAIDAGSIRNLGFGWVEVGIAEGSSVDDALAALSDSGMQAQPNYFYKLCDDADGQTGSLLAGSADLDALGNEPYTSFLDDERISEQTVMPVVRMREAYSYLVGEGYIGAASDGSGPIEWKRGSRPAVAILDTGCDISHPDLAPNVVDYYDAVNSTKDGFGDIQTHGTHVAGIIAAVANNGRGCAGTSLNAGIVPINVFCWENGALGAYSADILKGYAYAMDNADRLGIRIVNMSLGATCPRLKPVDYAITNAIDDAYENAGILTVIAAGNDADRMRGPYFDFPCDGTAHALGVISLGVPADMRGSGNPDELAASLARKSYSNYNGAGLASKQLGGYGDTVLSCAPGNGYSYKSGTSMAAPCVAGIAALAARVNPGLGAAQLRSVVMSSATDLEGSGFDQSTGFGCIDAEKAVRNAAASNCVSTTGNVRMVLGSTRTSVELSAPGATSWTSSAPDVAKVDASGHVEAVSAGQAAIVADTGAVEVVTVISAKIDGASSVKLNTINGYFVTSDPVMGSWSVSFSGALSQYSPGISRASSTGIGTVVAELDGDGSVKMEKEVSVSSNGIGHVEFSPRSAVYDGHAHTPAVRVYSTDGKLLRPGTDYVVEEPRGRTGAGSYTYKVRGTGSCEGEVSADFVIEPKPILPQDVMLSGTEFTYGDAARTPVVSVVSDGRALSRGTHYTVAYPADTSLPGAKTVTVTGRGNYSGTIEKGYEVKMPSSLVSYRTHVQNVGWQGWSRDGEMSGTSGQALRLEGLIMNLPSPMGKSSIQYRTHVQNIGWQDWVSDNGMAGTSGKGLRLEAVQIRLTGKMAQLYDVYYQVHVQNVGWTGWARNGASAGSAGHGYRLEGIRVKLVLKGSPAPGSTESAFIEGNRGYSGVPDSESRVLYRTHVQNDGWQGFSRDGEMAGTSGRALRLEGLEVKLGGAVAGSVRYKTHVQNIGWQDWVRNGQMSGTSGKALRLEALCIELQGDAAARYDVYYRVHCQNFGWMGWARNGEQAGSAGYGYRLEGLEIVLVEKGGAPPGSTQGSFRQKG